MEIIGSMLTIPAEIIGQTSAIWKVLAEAVANRARRYTRAREFRLGISEQSGIITFKKKMNIDTSGARNSSRTNGLLLTMLTSSAPRAAERFTTALSIPTAPSESKGIFISIQFQMKSGARKRPPDGLHQEYRWSDPPARPVRKAPPVLTAWVSTTTGTERNLESNGKMKAHMHMSTFKAPPARKARKALPEPV